MTREAALILTIALVVVLIGVAVWAWRRRSKRDAVPLAPAGELPPDATVTGVFDTLYVATTVRDAPLERLAAPGLGFRSRATVTVSDRGIALDLTGQPRIVIAKERIVDVGQSTVAIDRVVERDGLTRLAWRTQEDAVVDSYFRPQNSSARVLADAIADTLDSTSTPMGTDA